MRASARREFQPTVEPAVGVSEHEAQERETLLHKASASDHDLAARSVVELYQEFMESCTSTKRKNTTARSSTEVRRTQILSASAATPRGKRWRSVWR